MTRRSQNSDAQKLENVFPEYEPPNALDTPLKQDTQNPTQDSTKVKHEEGADLDLDQTMPSSSYQTDQPLGEQTTGSTLVVTPLAVDSDPVMLPVATSTHTTQPGYERLIHLALQSGLSSSSLTIVHRDWAAPSHLESLGDAVLPSPTDTFASSFDSYSPIRSNSSSPRFFFADSNIIYQHPGMASSSTLVTPTGPEFDLYMQPSFRSSEATLVEQGPKSDFHGQPATPVGLPHSPALGDISFDPYYPPYTVEGGHMLQLQAFSQEPLAMHQVKEEEAEIDTDEWLNNDYIMSQENNYTG